MASPELPFQPELFSGVTIDITCAYLLLSVFNFTFAVFSQGITYHSWWFSGFDSVPGSKAHAVLSVGYSDFKACDERALLIMAFSVFTAVLAERLMALAGR